MSTLNRFCLVAVNENEGWIVETKYVFKSSGNGKKVPINLQEDYQEECVVLHPCKQINDVRVLNSDDDYKNLKENYCESGMKIRTLAFSKYSPQVTKETTKKQQPSTKTAKANSGTLPSQQSGLFYRTLVQPNPPLNNGEDHMPTHDLEEPEQRETLDEEDIISETELEEQPTLANHDDENQNSTPSRENSEEEEEERPPPRVPTSSRSSVPRNSLRAGNSRRRGVIRRQGVNRIVTMVKRIDRLEKTTVSLKNTTKKLIKKLDQSGDGDGVAEDNYPNLTETIIKEGDDDFVQIEGLKIDGDAYSEMVVQRSMRGRANKIMHQMWPQEVKQHMYLKSQPGIANSVVLKTKDVDKIKKICLFLQRKKRINYIKGDLDDPKYYTRYWAGELFRQSRKKIKVLNAQG